MLYGEYLRTVAEHFKALLDQIDAEHNFDLGPEFEIALCKALRVVLPSRFGLCRGYVVAADGKAIGDDIIVFDRERFGTLRLLEQDHFDRKEKIPVETVCAYIEAKHTLCLSGKGGQSLAKALAQVAAVKSIPRAAVPFSQITPSMNLDLGSIFTMSRQQGWPPMLNPLFGAIWAKQVRLSENAPALDDPVKIRDALAGAFADVDLLVAGPSVIGIPVVSVGGKLELRSPYRLPGESELGYSDTSGMSFAIGVAMLLWALDNMQMLGMPWTRIILDAFSTTQIVRKV